MHSLVVRLEPDAHELVQMLDVVRLRSWLRVNRPHVNVPIVDAHRAGIVADLPHVQMGRHLVLHDATRKFVPLQKVVRSETTNHHGYLHHLDLALTPDDHVELACEVEDLTKQRVQLHRVDVGRDVSPRRGDNVSNVLGLVPHAVLFDQVGERPLGS